MWAHRQGGSIHPVRDGIRMVGEMVNIRWNALTGKYKPTQVGVEVLLFEALGSNRPDGCQGPDRNAVAFLKAQSHFRRATLAQPEEFDPSRWLLCLTIGN